MPYEIKCSHKNCGGGPCKKLTPSEVIPTPEDRAYAELLLSQGWVQVSHKYCMLRRWKVPPPKPEQMLRPEFMNTYAGKEALRILRNLVDGDMFLRTAPNDLVEDKTLSVPEFKAYKEIQNREWRRALGLPIAS